MASANIVISQAGVATPAGQSNDQLALAQPVQLRNEDDRGVRSWRWELLDVPKGSAAVLSNPTAAAPTFTPDLVGSYFVRLTVNGGQQGEVQDRIAAVRDFRGGAGSLPAMGFRIMAAGEEAQANWASADGKGYYRDLVDLLDAVKAMYTLVDLGGAGGEANTTSNEGGFAELALPKSGVNLPFRTIQSSDGSLNVTQNALDLDLTVASGGSVVPVVNNFLDNANLDLTVGQVATHSYILVNLTLWQSATGKSTGRTIKIAISDAALDYDVVTVNSDKPMDTVVVTVAVSGPDVQVQLRGIGAGVNVQSTHTVERALVK